MIEQSDVPQLHRRAEFWAAGLSPRGVTLWRDEGVVGDDVPEAAVAVALVSQVRKVERSVWIVRSSRSKLGAPKAA